MTFQRKTIEKSRLARFIHRWRADLLIVGVGFLYQMVFRLFTYRLGFDDLIQIACGLSFARGGRLGTLVSSPSDISAVQYWLMAWWPPGYSVLIAGLVRLFGRPYFAAIGAEMMGLAVLGAATALLLYRLGPSLSRNGRLLVACVSGWWGPAILAWNTNVWALALFLGGIALLCPDEGGEFDSRWARAVGGALLALTIPLRWAYAPLSVTAAVAASIDAGWRRRRWTDGNWVLGAWLSALLPLVCWKFGYADDARLGRMSFHGHLYLESLAKYHAFAVDALFGRRLSEHFPSASFLYHQDVDPFYFGVRHLLSLIVLVASVIGARSMIRRAPTPQAKTIVVWFFSIGLIVTIVNVAFLTSLTLINKPEPLWGGWTYISEPRYYSVSFPFILMGAAAAVTMPFDRSLSAVFRGAVAVLFAFSAVLWVVDLPREFRAVRRGHVGPTLDRYLEDRGLLYDVFRGVATGKPTVFVEVGTDFDYPRQAEATIFGMASTLIHPGETLRTSSERQIIMMSVPFATRENRATLDRLCREYGGVSFDYETQRFCRATLRPSSGPSSPPHG